MTPSTLNLMRTVTLLLSAALLGGCTGARKNGISRYDAFNEIRVDQMVGNNVSGKIMEKTVLCLNARRETRVLKAITNETVLLFTNPVVVAVTNVVVSLATNYSVSAMTNIAPTPAFAPAETPGEAGASQGTNAPGDSVPQLVASPPTGATNATVAVSTNQTLVLGPSQTATGTQITRNFSDQVTTTVNNLSITAVTNQAVTAETNLAVNYSTNYAVTAVTNTVITPTSGVAHACFLYTELLAPPDFTLFNGESLVLLIDGQRFGFTATPGRIPFVGRRGYVSTLYAVPPQVLVAIANAQQVRIRVNGTSSTIEKTMTAGSRSHFKKYLLKHFRPDLESPTTPDPDSSAETDGCLCARR
ncbi:MAG: hypothetical protein JXQ71_06895 [Verrucomicrobia bacterium]|nr:hypothetical protein [Verrucomicrobiota bacterium]